MDVRPLRERLLVERDLDISLLPPEKVERVVAAGMERLATESVEELASCVSQGDDRCRFVLEDLVALPEAFFADEELTGLLEKRIIPQLLESRKIAGSIRVWVVNCRRGYIAYDIALLLYKALGPSAGGVAVRLIATDTDERIITAAQSRDYLREVSGESVRSRMSAAGKRVQLPPPDAIRRSVIFRTHDPVRQPPYPRQDMIVCCGYLPLLSVDDRVRVITKLVQGLATGGVLISGRGELLGFGAESPSPSQPFSVLQRRIPQPPDLRGRRGTGVIAPRPVGSFVERLRMPVLIVDARGDVVVANEAAEDVFRISDLVGCNLATVGEGGILADIAVAVRSGEIRLLRREPWWIVGVVPIATSGGEPPMAAVALLTAEPLADDAATLETAREELAIEFADMVARAWEHDRDMDQLKTQSMLVTHSLYQRTEELNRTRDELQRANAELRVLNEQLQGVLEEREKARAQLQAAYDREHHIAQTLQESLLPPSAGAYDGYAVATRYLAAFEEAEVGGDFHYVDKLRDGMLVLALGDVSGKGLEAAVFAYMVKYMLLGFVFEDAAPASLLSRLNRALVHYADSGWFVTLMYMLLDVRSNRLLFGNAGHEPVACYFPATDVIEHIYPTGRALGLMAGGEYEERAIDLSPGDVVLVYTDGISDAGDRAHPLGAEGVGDILRRQATQAPSAILEHLYDVALTISGGRLLDDAATICLKREA